MPISDRGVQRLRRMQAVGYCASRGRHALRLLAGGATPSAEFEGYFRKLEEFLRLALEGRNWVVHVSRGEHNRLDEAAARQLRAYTLIHPILRGLPGDEFDRQLSTYVTITADLVRGQLPEKAIVDAFGELLRALTLQATVRSRDLGATTPMRTRKLVG